jgi:hypothetical protein
LTGASEGDIFGKGKENAAQLTHDHQCSVVKPRNSFLFWDALLMPQIVAKCGKLRSKPETKKQANLSGKNPHNPFQKVPHKV